MTQEAHPQEAHPSNHDAPDSISAATSSVLRSYIERIVRLEEDKDGLAADIKDIYGQMKGDGFDVKVIKALVAAIKKNKANEVRDQHQLFDLYYSAMKSR